VEYEFGELELETGGEGALDKLKTGESWSAGFGGMALGLLVI
jgi:hypothetical protein